MTARTWRQSSPTLLAAVDEPLSREAVAVALAAAAYRWGAPSTRTATLLACADDLATARDLAHVPGSGIGDVREVDGLPGAGWALAWTFEQGANT